MASLVNSQFKAPSIHQVIELVRMTAIPPSSNWPPKSLQPALQFEEGPENMLLAQVLPGCSPAERVLVEKNSLLVVVGLVAIMSSDFCLFSLLSVIWFLNSLLFSLLMVAQG